MPGRRLILGFSLAEMLVGLAILSLILLLIASQIDLTNKTYAITNGKIQQFRAARLALTTMTRQLAQATLNNYLDLVDSAGNPPTASGYNGTPDHYQRQSELRFYSGPAQAIPALANSPTHTIFFCAPLGVAQGLNPFSGAGTDLGMEHLLNICGFYIQYGPGNLPTFFPAAVQRYRFRLMEMLVPTENFGVYRYTVAGTQPYLGMTWFTDNLNSGNTRVLADNVVALIIMPKISSEQEAQLRVQDNYVTANTYVCDSGNPTAKTQDGVASVYNQLPPVLQVTLVAIDEASATRLQSQSGSPGTMPLLVPAGTFTSVDHYQSDLALLTQNLQSLRLSFRVFTSNIDVTEARWSTDKSN